MNQIYVFVAGFILGAVLVIIFNRIRTLDSKNVAQELLQHMEHEKNRYADMLFDKMEKSFGMLSLEALSRNTREFLIVANETLSRNTQAGEKDLEGKKQLIDRTLETMRDELTKIQDVIGAFERDRAKKFGELANQLHHTSEQTLRLQETTNQLNRALSNTKTRGQWGERMAEDVLRMAGFVEGINYVKQKNLTMTDGRPDYTFFLPQDLKVNMDVKFPLDNYLKYLEAEHDIERDNFKNQ